MTVKTRLGKITAREEVLNRLSIALFEAANSNEAKKKKKELKNVMFLALIQPPTKYLMHYTKLGTTQNNNKLTYRLDGRKRGKKNEKI